MGAIKVVIPDELERELRQFISDHEGYYKGALSETVQTALEQFLQSGRREKIIPDENQINSLRKQYPGKYLGIVNEDVKFICETLEELFTKVATEPEKVMVVHPSEQQRKVRLGWKSKIAS